MPTITKKQKVVFDFINSYISRNGISPTIEEIRKKLKLKAVSTIHEHINSLKEKGYLSKSENYSVRSLSVKKKIEKVVQIPIVGKLIAWQPNIKTKKDSNVYFALRAEGNSMSEEGIFDGDIVIIKDKKD
jgi:repressor LexA